MKKKKEPIEISINFLENFSLMNLQLAKGTIFGVINILFGSLCLYFFNKFLSTPSTFIRSWDSQADDDTTNA
jgi:hypothetical protein